MSNKLEETYVRLLATPEGVQAMVLLIDERDLLLHNVQQGYISETSASLRLISRLKEFTELFKTYVVLDGHTICQQHSTHVHYFSNDEHRAKTEKGNDFSLLWDAHSTATLLRCIRRRIAIR